MSPDEVIDLCMEHLPHAQTFTDQCNIRIAARLAWEQKEMGGIEWAQFAHRNNTPIVPMGHCCHPIELLKRGFKDGTGWPARSPKINLFRWPDGKHWYATLEDGSDVQDEQGNVKWDTQAEAIRAADRMLTKTPRTPRPQQRK